MHQKEHLKKKTQSLKEINLREQSAFTEYKIYRVKGVTSNATASSPTQIHQV